MISFTSSRFTFLGPEYNVPASTLFSFFLSFPNVFHILQILFSGLHALKGELTDEPPKKKMMKKIDEKDMETESPDAQNRGRGGVDGGVRALCDCDSGTGPFFFFSLLKTFIR